MQAVAARTSASRIACALLALALTLLLAGTAHAATTFTVNTTADPAPPPPGCAGAAGDCSIRQALAASSTGDTILVPPGHYLLTKGSQLDIDKSVTIKGTPGDSPATTVVDAQGNSQVFFVDADATPATTIEGLTITGGKGDFGGGIVNFTPLNVINDVVTGNTATLFGGGIASSVFVDLAPRASAPTFSTEALTIASSLIADNHVLRPRPPAAPTNRLTAVFDLGGGGIGAAEGGVSLTNSTVADNSVDANGNNETAGGGGILVGPNSKIETLNVTVNANSVTGSTGSAGGGIAGGFIDNAPKNGVAVAGNFTAQNTIVSRNQVTVGTTTTSPQDCAGVTTSSDANISTDSKCGFTDSASKQNTDPAYTSTSPQDNGGLTATLGINEASPAFNTGDATNAPNVDQRGVARPQAGAWDVGAFEYVPSADLQITKTGSPLSVIVGQNITYTLTVRNNGPDSASGVTVTDTLPATETLVSATPSQGTCSALTCTLGNLASGASATVTVLAHTTKSGSVVNGATVRGDQSDPNLANNTASATNAVAAVAPSKVKRPTVHVVAARCYRSTVSLAVSVSSSAALRGVRVLLGGHLILKTKKKHFTIHIHRLSHTSSTLTIVARNGGGKSPTKHVTLRRCHIPKPHFTG